MILRELVTRLGFDFNQAQLDRANREFDDMRSKAEKVGGTFKRVGGQLTTFVTLPLVGLVAALGATASNFQSIQTQFEVLTGNADTAKQALKELKEFSAGTPFQFNDLAMAGAQLLGFQIPASELKETLRQIGDVSAAVNRPIGELALIFGQVRAAGKLTGERLLQLQERAVPIGPAIAKTLGIAETAVRDAVSEGRVDLATFEKAFASLSQEGGAAFQGIAKQAKTLGGQFSTLKDNVVLLADSFAQPLIPLFEWTIQNLTKLTGWLRDLSPFWKNFILIVGVAAAALGPLLLVLGGIISSLPFLIAGFKSLSLVLVAVKTAGLAALAPFLFWPAIIIGAILLLQDLWVAFTGGKSVLGDFGNWIQGYFNQFTGWVTKWFDDMSQKVSSWANSFVDWFSPVTSFLSGFADFVSGAISPVSGILSGFAESVSGFANTLTGGSQRMMGANSVSPSQITNSPSNVSNTSVNQNANLKIEVNASGMNGVQAAESVADGVETGLSNVFRQAGQNFVPGGA